jgi:DNA-binding NarL/FixJ family response regulator
VRAGFDKEIRVVLADDHPSLLELIGNYLERRGFTIVARARNGREALSQIEQEQPDVAILDQRMPALSGVEVARGAARSRQQTGLILFTGFGDHALMREAFDVGVRGFVGKELPLDDLERAVVAVGGGRTWIDPLLAGNMVSDVPEANPQLTHREREILRLLAAGLDDRQIGERLHIAIDTVRAHLRNAMVKLGADKRTHAIAVAIRQSIIS